MIYHRQRQRNRKKYHLISQMSNSPRNIFRFNLSSLPGFVERMTGKKRKNYRKEEDTRIIRLRQSAITSYFPRHRSNQFRPSPKNNRPSPEVSLDIIRRVNNGVQVSGSPGLDTITRRDPVEPTLESTKGKRRDEMVETCAIPSFVPLTETYLSPFYSFYIP